MSYADNVRWLEELMLGCDPAAAAEAVAARTALTLRWPPSGGLLLPRAEAAVEAEAEAAAELAARTALTLGGLLLPRAVAEAEAARAAKADQASRFMERKTLTETADVWYFKKIVLERGIAALVAEVKSEKPQEEDADVWTQALVFVTTVLDAATEVALANCVKTSLVPEVADALGTFRHCPKLACKALELLNKITEIVKHVRDADNRDDPLHPPSAARMRVWMQLSTATGLCFSILCSSSPQLSDSALCEAGFRFLANTLLNDVELMHYFVGEHGIMLVDLCLTALRMHRTATFIVVDAALTLQTAVDDSEDLAMFALQHNAVKLLIEATPMPLNFTKLASHATRAIRQLEFSAQTVAALFKAAFLDSAYQALAVRFQDAAVSDGMIELFVCALRAGMERRDSVVQILLLCCAQKPAYAMRAIKAGALELEDEPGSTEVRSFVNRLKSLMDDAEASADAAAAELLAGEDAERARAAAAKAKAKRKKKPAAPIDATPPAADAAASAGEEPPADRGSAFELSQSESALRRRRRAATKAARRTAAVERARGGGAQPAESSSDAEDDEPSGAGDEPPPLPSFLADLKAPTLGGPARSPAADAPPPAEVADRGSLADLFPWLAAPISAAARATPPAAPPLEPDAPAPSLSPIPASQTVLLERVAALFTELACVKDELNASKCAMARIQDELDASKCVICLCAPRCVAVLPCRHLPLCASTECAAMMGTPPLCPLCRVRVADTMQLFV